MSSERNGNLFNAGFALAVGLVLSSIVLGWAYSHKKNTDETITVTGSARKRITSDLVVWRATVTYQSAELSGAYGALKENVPRVRAYLVSKGIPDEQIVVSSVTTQKLQEKNENGEDTGRVSGYVMSQTLEVRS